MTRELPAYSPLSLRALLGGGVAALGGHASAAVRVRALVRADYGSADVVFTDSGTTALALALRLVTVPGDAPVVAMPGYACYDLVTAAQMAGVRVVLYDIDPATLQPDAASLEACCAARRATAIVVVHLFGIPVDVEAVRSIGRRYGARIVEDAAQGVGAAVGDTPAGALGDVGVLSFGRGKGRTGGGGGALLVNDPSLVAAAASVTARLGAGGGGARLLAAAAAQWLLGRPALFGVAAALPGVRVGETLYHAPWTPREMPAAALGVLEGTWREAAREAARRRQAAEAWRARLRACTGIAPVGPVVPGATAGYLRFPVLALQGPRPVAAALGLMPGYPETLERLAQEQQVLADTPRLPGSLAAATRLFTLPTHSRLSVRAVSRLLEVLA